MKVLSIVLLNLKVMESNPHAWRLTRMSKSQCPEYIRADSPDVKGPTHFHLFFIVLPYVAAFMPLGRLYLPKRTLSISSRLTTSVPQDVDVSREQQLFSSGLRSGCKDSAIPSEHLVRYDNPGHWLFSKHMLIVDALLVSTLGYVTTPSVHLTIARNQLL